jgi:drug/metabolite transporter (DMT)-like permease
VSKITEPARQNLHGILAVLASSALFMCNDTLTKLNLAVLPLGEILFLRNVIGAVLCAGLAAYLGALRPPRVLLNWPVALRTAGEVLTTTLFLSALALMPIANVNGIMQSTPLVLTAAGALFLGERVGWRRWLATCVGLSGVLLIVKPASDGFNIATVFAIGAVITVVLRDVATKRIPYATPALLLTLVSSISVLVTGLAMRPFEIWTWPDGVTWVRLAASAGFLTAALYFSVTAMRLGDLGVITPFRFSSVIWALVMGYIVWNEVPDRFSLAGMAIVVSAGLYTFHRERVRRAQERSEAPK